MVSVSVPCRVGFHCFDGFDNFAFELQNWLKKPKKILKLKKIKIKISSFILFYYVLSFSRIMVSLVSLVSA